VITILAEMGVLGALLLLNIILQVYKNYRILARHTNEQIIDYSKMITAMLIIIFISAQAAGRLFEDPLLWLIIGMQVSMLKLKESHVPENYS